MKSKDYDTESIGRHKTSYKLQRSTISYMFITQSCPSGSPQRARWLNLPADRNNDYDFAAISKQQQQLTTRAVM